MGRRIIFAVAVLAGSAALCAAADYYVATNGNDIGAGSLALPWATIQHAVDHAAPGDRILVRGGEYRQRVSLDISGTSNAPSRSPRIRASRRC